MKRFKDDAGKSWEYEYARKQQRKQSKQLRSQKRQRKGIWVVSE